LCTIVREKGRIRAEELIRRGKLLLENLLIENSMSLPQKPDKSRVTFLLLIDIQPVFEKGQILLVNVLHMFQILGLNL